MAVHAKESGYMVYILDKPVVVHEINFFGQIAVGQGRSVVVMKVVLELPGIPSPCIWAVVTVHALLCRYGVAKCMGRRISLFTL
jgi:hypothetical protein